MGGLPLSSSKKNFSKHSCFPEIGLFLQATYPFWYSKVGLFSRVTYPFQIPIRNSASIYTFLKLVYFHGRPTLFKFQKELQQVFMLSWNWSIFTSDLSILKFKSQPIFTGDPPFSNSKKNFNKHSCFLKLVYFHGRPVLFKFQIEL